MPRAPLSPLPSGSPDPIAFATADVAFTRYNARRAMHREDSQLEARSFGSATALRDAARRDGYYNRTIGMSAGDARWIPDLCAWYAELALPCRITLHPHVPGDLEEALLQQGFESESEDAFLAAPCSEIGGVEAGVPTDPNIEIRRAGPQDLDDVFDLWPAPGTPRIEDSVRNERSSAQMDPSFAIYLARLDGRPVAMATTFHHAGFAWLGNANTLPAFRRRGCQSALLRRRISDACKGGSTWVLTDAERGSTSYRNADRAGLHPCFVTTTVCASSPG